MAAGATGTTSRTFPATMAFQRTWRAYQARVLECLDSYLDDKRLHLAAAPGSGKTILGLEVIRRLDQPTLVLAPTIAVRDRWVETSYGLLSPARRANSIVGLTRLEDAGAADGHNLSGVACVLCR